MTLHVLIHHQQHQQLNSFIELNFQLKFLNIVELCKNFLEVQLMQKILQHMYSTYTNTCLYIFVYCIKIINIYISFIHFFIIIRLKKERNKFMLRKREREREREREKERG